MIRLALVLALLAAPVAVAQEPPDERVAARAMADAVDRFVDVFEPASEALDITEKTCRRELRRLPEAESEAAIFVLTRYFIRTLAQDVRAETTRLRTEIGNVQSRDPVLLSGRAAWRQLARVLAATPEPQPLCAELRAWRRAGYPRSTPRRAAREVLRFEDVASREFDRKTRAAIERMIELGVPAALARRFDGD